MPAYINENSSAFPIFHFPKPRSLNLAPPSPRIFILHRDNDCLTIDLRTMPTRPIFIRRLCVQFTPNYCFPGTSLRPNDVRKKMINDYRNAPIVQKILLPTEWRNVSRRRSTSSQKRIVNGASVSEQRGQENGGSR